MSNLINNYIIVSEWPTDVEFFIYMLKNKFNYKIFNYSHSKFVSNGNNNFIFVYPMDSDHWWYWQLLKKETYVKARYKYRWIKWMISISWELCLKVLIRSDTEHRSEQLMKKYRKWIDSALRESVWKEEISEYSWYEILFADRQLENRYLAWIKADHSLFKELSVKSKKLLKSWDADEIVDPKSEVDKIFPEYIDSRLLAKDIWDCYDVDLAKLQSKSFSKFYDWIAKIS